MEDTRDASENIPQALSPFLRMEEFLKERTGIPDSERRNREVTIGREEYVKGSNLSAIKQPLPLRINLFQFPGGNITIRITDEIPNPFKEGEPSFRSGWDVVSRAKGSLYGSGKNEARIFYLLAGRLLPLTLTQIILLYVKRWVWM